MSNEVDFKAGALFEFAATAGLEEGDYRCESKIAKSDGSGGLVFVADVAMSAVVPPAQPGDPYVSVATVLPDVTKTWLHVLYWDVVWIDVHDETVRIPMPTVTVKVKPSPTNTING